jgi:multicomponent Na+:H+ antiporter subunit F
MTTGEVNPWIAWAAWGAGGLLAAGMVLTFLRIVLGPTLADRVVAVDVLATMVIGALAVVALATGTPLLLDIALAIALIVFLGTVAMAMSIERGIFK